MTRSTKKAAAPVPNQLGRIKHLVVVMLENRSFDNLLGWLYEKEAPPRNQHYEGLHSGLWNPLDNIDADGIPFVEKVYVRKNGEAARGSKSKTRPEVRYNLPVVDPGEGYRCTNHQLFGHYQVASLYPPEPANQGFVNDYRDANLFNSYAWGGAPTDPREIMITYTPQQVPVLSTLARQFAVCDQWFASVPSQTLPNRHFVHAATSDGQVNNHPNGVCGSRTIYNVIQDAIAKGCADLSWRVYCGTEKGKQFSLTRTVMTQLHDSSLDANFLPIERFYVDAAANKLPSYAFLEPQLHDPGQCDQHPPADVRPGDEFLARIYNAVVNSKQWNETLLVITYDEHGGCYDHVAPPKVSKQELDSSPPAGQDGFRFNRFGVRVPAVLVSPWIEAGTICRPGGWVPFDHTSVLATAWNCFKLGEPLSERQRAAPDLGCALTLPKPRTDKPKVKPLPYTPSNEPVHVNDLHRLIAEVLEKLTGHPQPGEHKIFDYIYDAYESLLSRRSKAAGQ